MLRSPRFIFLLGAMALAALACAPRCVAEERAKEGSDKIAEKQPDAAPPAATKAELKPTVNTVYLETLRAFCAQRGWAIAEHGKASVRAMLIGGAAVENFDKGMALANQALDGIEVWTGGQETFIAKAPKPEDLYWICVFAAPDQVSTWIDHLREKKMIAQPEGDDLYKKLLAFPGDRAYFTHVAHIGPIFEPFAVYSATCLAMDAFYMAHGIRRGPAWLREGMAAELQRTLCKSIPCTTIAYQDKAFPMSESWARDVATLIKKGDRQVRPASELMRLKLESLANVQYQQMWSLCSFVRGISGAKKGPDNKFRKLLEATASGTDSEAAMRSVYKLVDPAFSKGWCEWAAGQK
jgi:hypothetical protein